MGLDWFFAGWFVVGNVPKDAPNLYWLCMVFLAFNCAGYAMSFILCAIFCCCLLCIISIMGFREDMGHDQGATPESINALPTCKFKSKRQHSQGDGGIFAPGTDKDACAPFANRRTAGSSIQPQ